MNLYLAIMAGGSGTRFWPKSTSKMPKQFLSFSGKKTLIGQTQDRFEGIIPYAQHYILTTEALSDLVKESTHPDTKILAEPQGRNTAPCLYWAARVIAEKDPDAVIVTVPSDHHMARLDAFRDTVKKAAQWASTHDDLVTLGIKPTRPETGYGYLKAGKKIEGETLNVDAFVEKPNLDKAKEFLKAGNYFWNGGMFLWKASTILKAFDEFMPEMKKAWDENAQDVKLAYPKMTATSIDFGVMEKAKNVVTFELDCGWDDIGGWNSFEELGDVFGRVLPEGVVLNGDVVSVDSKSNIVDAKDRLVALLGVNDLIVVESGRSILIADKNRTQEIRDIVKQVKEQHPDLA